LFSKSELEENKRKKGKLVQLLKAKEAILMAGAGCSASLYPDWLALINLLHRDAIHSEKLFLPLIRRWITF
jgi:hypothetical protein